MLSDTLVLLCCVKETADLTFLAGATY